MGTGISKEDYYQITIILLVISLQLSLIRWLRTERITEIKAKNEEEAMKILKGILKMCTSKDPCSGTELANILCKHAHSCDKSDCDCKQLLMHIADSKSDYMQINLRTHHTYDEISEQLRKSWKFRTLKILLADIHKQFSRSDEVAFMVGQIAFLFLGNQYITLWLTSNILCKKPRYLLKIQVFNLRQIISNGIAKGVEYFKDMLDSLEYQFQYQKFLNRAEKITDLTSQFWKSLYNEIPDTAILNKILTSFFNVRKKLIEVVDKLTSLNSNNQDFLIKYGVLAKYILNDASASTNAYNKLLSVADSTIRSWDKQTGFSLLRVDVKVSMILISIETYNFMVTLDINCEVETLLKCTRNELVGASIATIMPPMIAQAHQQYIHNFSETMKSTCIGVNKLRFLKCKDNLYEPCCTSKSLVPKIDMGYQGVMFSYLDPKITFYTSNKRANTFNIVLQY